MNLNKPLCALVVGHKSKSQGARNPQHNISEHMYNSKLAPMVKMKASVADVVIVNREGISYKQLPDRINELNPHFVVSLHCNAFNGRASGTEILYYHTSHKGRKLASYVYKELMDKLRLPARGLRARDVEQRGGFLLRYTASPCVICEPFFIDNNTDLSRGENYQAVATAYANGIDKFAEQLDWYQEQLNAARAANEMLERNENKREVHDEKVEIGPTNNAPSQRDAGVWNPNR